MAVFLYCCPDCISCLAHLNNNGWLLLAIPYLLSCYVYGSVYCSLYVRMCEWFFECTMRALVGFRGVGWPVRWRHLSEGAGQSALRK